MERCKISVFEKKSTKFANFWWARSQLYQNEILQEILHTSAPLRPHDLSEEVIRKFSKRFLQNVEFGAVQKCAHLLELAKCCETRTKYFLAKFRFDTAENEPAKNLQNFRIFEKCIFVRPLSGPGRSCAASSSGLPAASAASRSGRPGTCCAGSFSLFILAPS